MPFIKKQTIKKETVTITEDKRAVNCTVWNHPNSKKVMIIAPAMGVARRFYDTIATHFSQLSYSVISFDYYGMLEYEQHDQADIRLCDWGFRDMNSVIEYACQEFPDHTRHFLGHSIAGQVFPLAENSNKISSACLVASQNVSKNNWSGFAKLKVNLFWYVMIPICIQLFGYVPAAGYGGKHHLHPSIASDWAKWGKSTEGILTIISKAWSRYNGLKVPTKFLSFSDDDMLAPFKAVEHLYTSYGSRIKQHEHISPKDVGMTSIGHFKYFKKECSFLWDSVDSWFNRYA
ncbi:MAG: hypothetical protein AAF587_43555 [Bacteroidota bacterium]